MKLTAALFSAALATSLVGCATQGDLDASGDTDDSFDKDDTIVLGDAVMVTGPITEVNIRIEEDEKVNDKYTLYSDVYVLRGVHYDGFAIEIDPYPDGELGRIIEAEFLEDVQFQLYTRFPGEAWEQLVFNRILETGDEYIPLRVDRFERPEFDPDPTVLSYTDLRGILHALEPYADEIEANGDDVDAIAEDLKVFKAEYLKYPDMEIGVVPVLDYRLGDFDLDGEHTFELEVDIHQDPDRDCRWSEEGYRCF